MKKFLLITSLLFVLFGIVASAQAIDTIVKDYPALKACENPKVACKPGDENFGIAEFIKYIYLFSIGAVGLIGLVAIVIAAFDYTMSAGNPQKAALGKQKLLSALLGMVLLLGSAVLLNMINPDLLKLRLSADKVDIGDFSEEEEEGACRFLSASWNKGKINAGKSAILTISWDKESCKGKTLKKVKLPIRQERYGTDLGCGKVEKEIENILKNSFPNNSPFTYTYTFNKHCKKDLTTGINFPQTACGDLIDLELVICNYKEKDMDKDISGEETFYIEGTIKVDGQSKQNVPKLEIIVKDLDENDKCCR